MKIFPAIDIRGGKCVRLTQGAFDRENVYFDDPAQVAKAWKQKGIEMLHVVDLDGALKGERVNRQAIRQIGEIIPFELGGGIRSLSDVEQAAELGASRMIIGTAAIEQSAFVKEAVAVFGDQIVVSIDAKNGYITTDGWTKTLPVKATDFAKEMEDAGVSVIIYTDIAKDGMLQGPNFDELAAMQQAVSVDIIASGGISSMADIGRLRVMGLYGCIVGKALYEGKINVEELV